MHMFRSNLRSFTAVACGVALMLTTTFAAAAPAITITSPQPNAVLHGTVPVLAVFSGADGFSYAVLYVDATGRSAADSFPLRLELDTTKLKDGPHALKVSAFDSFGAIASSAVVPVTIINRGVDIQQFPQPAELPVKPQTVVETPVQPSAPVVSNRPQAATAAPKTAPQVAAQPSANKSTPIASIEDRQIYLDGKALDSYLTPILSKGRTLVMLRTLVDATGGTVSWDNVSKQGVALINDRQLAFAPGQNTVTIDGVAVVLDHPVTIASNRVFVPVTIWRNLMGGTVTYDAAHRSVLLRSNQTLVRADIASR